jgi:hypothetical protein
MDRLTAPAVAEHDNLGSIIGVARGVALGALLWAVIIGAAVSIHLTGKERRLAFWAPISRPTDPALPPGRSEPDAGSDGTASAF